MAARALLAALILAGATGHAQNIRLPGQPLAPRNYAECEAADAQWRKIIAEVQKRHSACLESSACKGRPRNPAYRGPCSCEPCHSLHDAKDSWPKLRATQGEACRRQVRAHLEQQKLLEEQLARSRAAMAAPASDAGRSSSPATPLPGPSGEAAAPPPEAPEASAAKLQSVLDELARISPGTSPQPPNAVSLSGTDGSPARLAAWATPDLLLHAALAAHSVYSMPRQQPGNVLAVSEPSSEAAAATRARLRAQGYEVDVAEAGADNSFMIAQKMTADRTHLTIISVEGTETSRELPEAASDWGYNLDAGLVYLRPQDNGKLEPKWSDCTGCIAVHRGFLDLAQQVYNSPEYRQQIALAKRNEHHRIVLTGHSQGSAASSLLAAITAAQHPEVRNRLSVVTYAPPGAFANERSVDWYNRLVPRSVHFVNHADIIRHTGRVGLHSGGMTYTFSGPGQPEDQVAAHDMSLYLENMANVTDAMRAGNRCDYCVLREPPQRQGPDFPH